MFDPPHLGHLILANEAVWQLGLDEVRLVPTARPPHRPQGWLPGDVRLRLAEAATQGYPALSVSDIELRRAGASYTVETLAQFDASEPGNEWWLIIGADQLAVFDTWREPERIVRLARLAVADRDGSPEGADPVVTTGRVDRIAMPTVAISSTMIRARISDGGAVKHLLPPAVHDILSGLGLTHDPTALP